MVGDLRLQILPPLLHGGGLMAAQGLVRPIAPGAAEVAPGGLEQGVFPQPGGAVRKGADGVAVLFPGPRRGLPQQRLPKTADGLIIHFASHGQAGGVQVRLVQQAAGGQGFQVDEQRIARKGGGAGIGGVL